LRGNFGISLPDLPESDEWLPSGYFNEVATAVASKRRWSIDADGVELGFYSSSKLLIVRDLEPANWPGDGLDTHPLVRGLLREGLASQPALFPEDVKLDAIFEPADLIHVVDAHSSQTRVIETVRAGATSSCTGRPAPANRRRSRTSSPPPSMTGNRCFSSPKKWPRSMSSTIG
jgi:hypothetical protein